MSARSQVTRNGVVIGEHDEQTLLALLNAGALRLSDSYWHRGMKAPAPLSDLLCLASRRTRLAGLRPWLFFAVSVALLASAFWLQGSALIKAPVQEPQVLRQLPPPAEPEVRRATPVLVRQLSFSHAPPAENEFPISFVEPLADHSRVSVLALDAQGRPLAAGSGVLIGDGAHVVTALRTVSGATTVEIHLGDGSVLRPSKAVLSVPRGLAIFELPVAGVPLNWAEDDSGPGSAVYVASHPLGLDWQPSVTRVAQSTSGMAAGMFQLATALPASFAGAGVLDSGGDLVGVVIDAAQGQALRVGEIRSTFQTGVPGGLEAVAALPRPPAIRGLEVVETGVLDGAVTVTLRNRTERPLCHILLYIACYEAPPEAAEVARLQERLRSAAVQASLAPDDAADASLSARQSLREVTERLESALARLRTALPAAQRKILCHQLLAIECDLPPGLPQSITHDLSAASNWGVVATIMDVSS